MKPNPLLKLLDDSKHTDNIKLNLRIAINVLTNALVSNGMAYIAAQRRGENPRHLAPINIDSFSNDENREAEFENRMRIEQGFDVPDIYRDMCILNGIREAMYDELYRFVDLPYTSAAALYTAPKATTPPNWDLPMSAETALDYRIRNAAIINEAYVKTAAEEEPDEDITVLREIFRQQALRDQARLVDMRDAVLTEIVGLPKREFDLDAFTALPPELQIRLLSRIRDKLDAEQRRLLPIQVRTQSAVTSGHRKLIKADIVELVTELDGLVKHYAGQLSGDSAKAF